MAEMKKKKSLKTMMMTFVKIRTMRARCHSMKTTNLNRTGCSRKILWYFMKT